MIVVNARQKPVHLQSAGKRDVRTQFGALPYRVKNGKLQVLLITSRGTGRWILPKGWPMDGATPAQAAATEAFEEAGVDGTPLDTVVGFYSYFKVHEKERLPVVVAIFPVRVRRLLNDWPEAGQRKRKWLSPKKAAKVLDEPELRQIVKHFDPRGM
ncbi:NUDIX hydrolase [Maritimibacter sp. UBA3975]|uniref:NUDIX hydrolase n=1 Tax=Maritimibacter sp. UBA3975 TaxID=1946833 RepID=UPI000C0B9F86|nr:NUDIX hydrolase [Maritimibacter sp. UBA3975]MAM60731.1 NUDIX hydrolase [Maritimibacter sp.]|tara:strand:+ start:17825 stop:18292 length:468 start_codon:yes stop_codon:yes gene_type:complete